MNKDYGLLDLRYLASYYGTLLGSSYRVELNSLEYPERREGITVVTLQAERVPFAVENVNAETLRVQLNFRLNTKRKAIVLADIAKLLGSRNFEIETYRENDSGEEIRDKAFTLYSFLDMPSAVNSPEIDTGAIMVTYEVRGTVLVTQKGCGATVSNHVETLLTADDGQFGDCKLATLSVTAKLSRSVENRLEIGDVVYLPRGTGHCVEYTIVALNLQREIERRLYEDIEIVNGDGLERYYYLQRVYPDGRVVKKRVMLTGGQIIEQAGAFSQFAVSLQEV